jgi:hypothetical protein
VLHVSAKEVDWCRIRSFNRGNRSGFIQNESAVDEPHEIGIEVVTLAQNGNSLRECEVIGNIKSANAFGIHVGIFEGEKYHSEF